jgi:hypothetical protein
MGPRGENVRQNNFLSSLPSPQGLSPLFSDVSKKQTVKNTKEESSLVDFILKLNLVHLLIGHAPQNLMPHALYLADYCRVKSTDNLCNQETKMVAGREALLTILAKVMEEELPVHQFVLELILVLSLYHSLCNLSRIRFYRTYNQGDNVARTEALLARERETLAKLCREYMGMQGLEAGDQGCKKRSKDVKKDQGCKKRSKAVKKDQGCKKRSRM